MSGSRAYTVAVCLCASIACMPVCMPTQYLQFVCQSACVPMVASVWLINVSKCLLVAVCPLNEYSMSYLHNAVQNPFSCLASCSPFPFLA